MPRGACTFKQTDVTKAIKAAVAAGIMVARVEVDREGKIVIIVGKESVAKTEGDNEWDGAEL